MCGEGGWSKHKSSRKPTLLATLPLKKEGERCGALDLKDLETESVSSGSTKDMLWLPQPIVLRKQLFESSCSLLRTRTAKAKEGKQTQGKAGRDAGTEGEA
jgi:hypothetical protein